MSPGDTRKWFDQPSPARGSGHGIYIIYQWLEGHPHLIALWLPRCSCVSAMWYDKNLFTWPMYQFRFCPEARGAADDDMQTYQGTEVGGWAKRYQKGTHSILQDIACKMSDVAGWLNLL